MGGSGGLFQMGGLLRRCFGAVFGVIKLTVLLSGNHNRQLCLPIYR